MVPEDIEMDEESEADKQWREEGTSESSYENEQSMDENDKKSDDQPEEENERPRFPIRRSQGTPQKGRLDFQESLEVKDQEKA